MPINFDDYISTSLRWSMFKADWPDATVEFSEGVASDAGVPASFSKKDEKVCIASVTRFTGDTPFVGYKSVSDAKGRDTDAWNVLCSKAMGRALKKAGSPDNMNDLKVLMRFREAIGTAKKVETKAAPAVETKSPDLVRPSVVAGEKLTQPSLPIESKEQPIKKLFDWRAELERDEAHKLFKQKCSDLTPDELETLRESHDRLNNRQWPMAKSELNTLIITLEGIYAGRKKEAGMIDIDTVKSMYEFSSPAIQEIVRNDMGNLDTWPEQISEQEYDRIVDMFESASERE
jgi:hypothetical protein